MNITELIKFDKVKEENEILKKELAEKDKEIIELKHQQLYKEDFEEYEEIESCGCGNKCDENGYLYACGDQITVSNFRLKDNSNYDKLPSKEDKTCI